MGRGGMATRAKQHFQREFNSTPYEVFQQNDGYWYGYVPDKVHPKFRTGKTSSLNAAEDACLAWIRTTPGS